MLVIDLMISSLRRGEFNKEGSKQISKLKAASIVLIVILFISTIAYGEVLAEEPVKIVEHKKYLDTSRLVHITGIIQNNGIIPVGPVSIKVNLADEQGSPLPSYETVASSRIVMPGYTTPFDIPISDRSVGERVSSYTLSIKWYTADAKAKKFEFSAIDAFSVSHLDPRTRGYMGSYLESHMEMEEDEVHAHTEVSGFVTNSGELTAKYVKVAVIWYDKDGKFYGNDWQYVHKRLVPGEKARFVFMTHPRAMGFYSIVADSDKYVTMLKLNDENIIPVYEAPRPNMNFPILNAISTSKVQLVDENGKPISDIKAGQMVLLQSIIKNNVNAKQKFISIYQVKDSDGTTVMLFWMSSQIPARESIDTAISWIPEIKSIYTLQVFLWESLKNPVPIGEYYESTITVSA